MNTGSVSSDSIHTNTDLQAGGEAGPSVEKRTQRLEIRRNLGALADLFQSSEKRQQSAMRRAIRKDDFEVFDALLQKGVDPKAKRSGFLSRTAVHLAAGRNVDQKYMAAIVASNPDMDLDVRRGKKERVGQTAFDAREGNTPLHEAARKGNLPVVRILVENGADPHALNWTGPFLAKTPLNMANDSYDRAIAADPDGERAETFSNIVHVLRRD